MERITEFDRSETNDSVMKGFTTVEAASPVQVITRGPRFANPAPLGVLSFASTTFLLSIINIHAHGLTKPQGALGMALGVGGLGQLVAGIWEFAVGNTFGATVFSSYAGFWFSFSAMLIPGTGVLASLGDDAPTLLGFYLASWLIFNFIILITSLRSSVAVVSIFFFLELTFLFIMAGYFLPSRPILITIGGSFGLASSSMAYYVGASELLTRGQSYITLPVLPLPKAMA